MSEAANARPTLLANMAQGEWHIIGSALLELSSTVASRIILAEIPRRRMPLRKPLLVG